MKAVRKAVKAPPATSKEVLAEIDEIRETYKLANAVEAVVVKHSRL